MNAPAWVQPFYTAEDQLGRHCYFLNLPAAKQYRAVLDSAVLGADTSILMTTPNRIWRVTTRRQPRG